MVSAEERADGDAAPAKPQQARSPSSVAAADEFDAQEMNNLSMSYEGEQRGDGDGAPDAMVSVHDLIGLTQLDEPAILRALRARYDAGIIYTSTGPILIAVNPFQKMDRLYSPEVMERYRREGEGTLSIASPAPRSGSSNGKFHRRGSRGAADGADDGGNGERLPPHAYKTADDAYRAMRRGLENAFLMSSSIVTQSKADQSILVSGESGAGKTVTTKIALHYFARLSRQIALEEELLVQRSRGARRNLGRGRMTCVNIGGGSGERMMGLTKNLADGRVGIEQQVLQSNPILEAFGNARTIRNDNSSRFGKYIDIRFTSSGKLAGANIDTYLLEKVRLIRPSYGERNYHIFYQFLEAVTAEERHYLGLDGLGVEHFKLLNCTGGTVDRRDDVEDGEMHREMLDAMETIGFDPEAISSILRLIAAILHCGNIAFAAASSRFSDACSVVKAHSSVTAARLLGVQYDDLVEALTCRDILAGSEVVRAPLDREAAAKGCEALMKAVYGAAFDHIVERVNGSISRQDGPFGEGGGEGPRGGAASIGVLDIFGFEIFQTNSYEQLCINYTNEALQQQFNKHVFKLEQTEYEREGISWKWITFPDNQEVLDLIDRRHTGVLALLDEQCIVRSSTDARLARYLYAKCEEHPRFSATSAQKADFKFSIEHYAGPVEYSTERWLVKNNDQLPVSTANLLMGSKFDLLSKIQKFIRTEGRDRRGSIASASVGAQFSVQLSRLRARIDATVPHYIRCLKPNDAMLPDSFDAKMIVDQLRCGGVLEAVRVSRAGYPTRYPHDVFRARYYVFGCGRAKDDTVATGEDTELKRLISKIAFNIWEVDRAVMAKKSNEANSCDTANGVTRPETAKGFLALPFSSRCTLAGLQLGRTKVFLRREALDRIEVLRVQKFGKSALSLQTFVRGVQARAYYRLLRRRMTHFAIVVQRAFRRHIKRLVLAPAAVKVQAIARGFITRMRKAAVERIWVPYSEFESLKLELETIMMERDELLSAEATMKRNIESLKSNVAAITAAREADAKRHQNELAEKDLMQDEILSLKDKLSDISAAKDAAVRSLEHELGSVRQQLGDTTNAACQEQGKLQTRLDTVATERDELLAAKATMMCGIESLLCFMQDITGAKEAESENLQLELAEKTLMQKEVSELKNKVTEIIAAKDEALDNMKQELCSARQQHDDAAKAACQEQKKLQNELDTIMTERDELVAIKSTMRDEIESLKNDVADITGAKEADSRAACEEQEKLQNKLDVIMTERDELLAAKATIALVSAESAREGESRELQKEEELSSKVSSLVADLMEYKKNEKMQENIILLLKRECEEYRANNQASIDAQIGSCESKVESLCAVNRKDRTFHDMISIIQRECSDIIAKSKAMARVLESPDGIHILSDEESTLYGLQNKGTFTNSLVEVLVDGEVKTLLISFCDMIESAGAAMSIEVSLMDQRLP